MLQSSQIMQYFWLIMNSKVKSEEFENSKELQEETKETKTFIQDIFKIDYSNTSKIFYQGASNSSDVKVNNYLCYQEGQNLYKITEIMYEDKIIRIEDRFEVSLDPSNLNSVYSLVEQKIQKGDKNCSRSIQKVRIFNKNINKETKPEKRDKKNIVKNIVKILLSWLEKKQDNSGGSQWSSALQQLRKLLEHQNFNNRLIQKMVNSKEVSKAFLAFLEDSAEDEIKYSRIQDKESHYEALQIYKNLLEKGSNQLIPSNSNSLQDNSSSQQASNSIKDNRMKSGNFSLQSHDLSMSANNGNSHEAGIKIKNQSTQDYSRKNKIVVFPNSKQFSN